MGDFFMKQKKKHRVLRFFAGVVVTVAVLVVMTVTGLFIYAENTLDFDADDALFAGSVGKSVPTFYGIGEDGGPVKLDYVPQGEATSVWCPYETLPDLLVDGYLAVEDRHYFEHRGVDLLRTGKAALNYLFHAESRFGGSTITQQVVKNISGDDDVSVGRKLSEILRALHMEHTHSKEEIFCCYVNIIPMGESLYGVGAASRAYFGKEVTDLSLSEIATLIGIGNAPTRYNPHTKPDACLEKRNRVLKTMEEGGVIDAGTCRAACAEPLGVLPKEEGEALVNSWFIETVISDVVADLCARYGYSEAAARRYLDTAGLSVYTTEDPVIQKTLEAYFSDDARFSQSGHGGLSYAMTVLDSRTGTLAGIIGQAGAKQGNRLLNYALVPRTPGSSLKPLALYAPAIGERRITWATVFDDVPDYRLGYAYPKNYPALYDGLTPVNEALAKSKNTVAAKLYETLGKEAIYGHLTRDFGFSHLVRSEVGADGRRYTDLALSPLALGQLTHGVTLRELSSAYTVFPADGVLRGARSYFSVRDRDGREILSTESGEKRIFSPECARVMCQLLKGVTENGTAKSITLKNRMDTAGKTGTSGSDRDRLFIGFTPCYTAGIWCGYADGVTPVGGQRLSHLRVWDECMTRIHEAKGVLGGRERFSTAGLVRAGYCRDSGLLYGPVCGKDARGNRLEYGYFLPGTEPERMCGTHVLVRYDTLTEGVACDGCPEENVEEVALLRLPERSFPEEVIVGDADYGMRELGEGIPPGDSFDMPYYQYALPPGSFVGRGRSKKQYNSGCYLHAG